MKYRLTRSTYFLIGVTAIIFAVGGFFLPEEYRAKVDQFSLNLFSPAWDFVDHFKQSTSGLVDDVRTIDELEDLVSTLETENARLAAESLLLKNLTEENKRLNEMVGFEKTSQYTLLPCRVIEREPSSWWNRIIVNRGTKDYPELQPDMPVLSPRGIIGKTGAVSEHTTRVILLVDENCKISAITESSRSRGIVQGSALIQGSASNCILKYVPRDANLAVGERVFTTGLGGTFPANLLIGTVVEAPPLSSDRNFGLYRDGQLKPTTDLNDLNEVFILTGMK
ncbi:MAG: rod shape-determining protein MreC [Verrucomicrobiota bacterium]